MHYSILWLDSVRDGRHPQDEPANAGPAVDVLRYLIEKLGALLRSGFKKEGRRWLPSHGISAFMLSKGASPFKWCASSSMSSMKALSSLYFIQHINGGCQASSDKTKGATKKRVLGSATVSAQKLKSSGSCFRLVSLRSRRGGGPWKHKPNSALIHKPYVKTKANNRLLGRSAGNVGAFEPSLPTWLQPRLSRA